MDELTAVSSQTAPRDAALVRRLGARFVPLWGFIAYGILYAFLAAMPAWLFAVLALAFLLGDRTGQGHPMGSVREALVFGGSALAIPLVYWPFVAWARRRRREAYLLFREGQLVQASVRRAAVIVLRHSRVTRAVLAVGPDGARDVVLSVSGTPPEIVPGAVLPLLTHPGSRYTAAFVAGRATAAR